jgi:outer membrane protein assembly factor BamB
MGARRAGMTRPVANAAEHDAWAALGYRISWRGFPIVARNGEVQHFDIFDDGILVQDDQNTVTYMDRRTGANLWITELGRPLTRFVGNATHGDNVLVSSDNEIFFLDARTGDIVDRQSLAVVVNTQPVIVGNIAFYGSATGEAFGHSLYSGFKAWGYQLAGSINATPLAMGDVVGVVSQGGDVIMIAASSGKSTGRSQIFDGVRSDPVSDGQSLYVAGMDQSVYAFASQDGRRLWRVRTESPISAQPVWAEGVLYVEIPGHGMVAFDSLSGEEIWANEDVVGKVVARRDDLLLVWDGSAMTTVVADNGDIVESVSLPNVQTVKADGFVDADLYATLKDGAVLKVNAQ